MAKLVQGSSYEPSTPEEEKNIMDAIEEENVFGVEEESKASGIMSYLNPKMLIGAGAIIVLLVIIVLVILLGRGGKSSEGDLPDRAAELENGDFLSPDTDEDFVEENVAELSFEQKAALAGFGMSADEISKVTAEEYDDLLSRGREIQKQQMMDTYLELKKEAWDKGSDEFRKLMSDSYLGLPPLTDLKKDLKADDITWNLGVRNNMKFVKIPLRGSQCYIKLIDYMNNVLFMEVSPAIYSSLPDLGNMVVEYDEYYIGGDTFRHKVRRVE